RALCAVARRQEVRALGIDAERLLGASTRPELGQRIAAPGELELLAAALAAPEPHLVSVVFSAKESLFKCLYPLVGKYMDFSAARVVEVSARPAAAGRAGELLLELASDWSGEF